MPDTATTGPTEGRVLRGSTLRARSGSATDVGRVRDQNEDCLLDAPGVHLVADGMGGHAAGEVASRIVVDVLASLAERPGVARAEDVTDIVREANDRIRQAQREDPHRRGMGTTVTGLTVVDTGDREEWLVLNVGDSRVYRLAGDRLEQVTRDHSEVRELVDAGLLDPAEAPYHPMRNVITRSLGADRAPEPDVWVLPPAAGERFLVCSDGLTGELDDDEIADILRSEPEPQAAADALVAAAVRAGGRDNVSVVVVAVEDDASAGSQG
jgi:protein phosphatase